MIGIWSDKSDQTNKLNGKSYVGQSIHCGKRFDEHSKGNQLGRMKSDQNNSVRRYRKF